LQAALLLCSSLALLAPVGSRRAVGCAARSLFRWVEAKLNGELLPICCKHPAGVQGKFDDAADALFFYSYQ
jgi:hypothetical protein